MTHKHNGGPAFPFGQTDSMSGQLVNGWGSEGMTKREYFAALAMQGLCTREGYDSPAMVALDAVAAADALLAELEVDHENSQPLEQVSDGLDDPSLEVSSKG